MANVLLDINFYKKNLRRILVETVLSSIGAGFSVAVITVFWNSIGMNQKDIGFIQMMFTIMICLLDIPMGYLADRFNRKVINVIGDFGCSFAFFYYAFSQNMIMTLISECLLGVFMAMTNGVDQSFIKYNCDMIDETGELFKKVNVKIHTAKYTALLLTAVIGGFIAKYNIRYCIGASSVPYFISGVLAILIKDFDGKIEQKHKNLLKDMLLSVKEIIADKKTRINLFCVMVAKEITHAQIWVFTPLLILVGVPIEIVSMGWVLNFVMQVIGSKVSEKMVKFKTSNKFAIPVIIEFVWLLTISIHTSIITVWLFALNGFVHGLLDGNLTTSLQETSKNEIQTSVMSVASTGARLLYIPLVYVINYLGNIQLQYALLGIVAIFLPMCLAIYLKLKKFEV